MSVTALGITQGLAPRASHIVEVEVGNTRPTALCVYRATGKHGLLEGIQDCGMSREESESPKLWRTIVISKY